MSTYDFEPDPRDFEPEPEHIANPKNYREKLALQKLIAAIDKKCGSGFIPWEIEDAFSEYMIIKKGTP